MAHGCRVSVETVLLSLCGAPLRVCILKWSRVEISVTESSNSDFCHETLTHAGLNHSSVFGISCLSLDP
jgi:hypothetical protein